MIQLCNNPQRRGADFACDPEHALTWPYAHNDTAPAWPVEENFLFFRRPFPIDTALERTGSLIDVR